MKIERRLMRETAVAAIVVAVLSVTGFASAQLPPDAQNFGGHVSSCAREMGFNAGHNPGRHQGAAGWVGSECQG